MLREMLSDRFELRDALGEGGMGVVHRAWDHTLDKEVAIKRVRDLVPREVQRLKSEFRARRALQHRNLVQLYELVTEGEDSFFTMELVEGSDLSTWVRYGEGAAPPSGPRSTSESPREENTATTVDGRAKHRGEARAARVKMRTKEAAPKQPLDVAGLVRLRAALTELCLGLAVLHDAGIVHRDVKPANIRVTSDGRVVLLDFGLAASPEPKGPMTVEGTPRYMAPEQVRAEATTPATDLYAVGVILYELLAGHSPFGGSVLSQQLQKAGDDRAPPIPPGGPDDRLAELAMLLLDPDPSKRPPARAVLDALAGDRRMPSIPPTFGLPVTGGFFGRLAEIDALSVALARTAETGAPTAVLVEGVSGIGKTTLVRWFVADQRRRDPKLVVLASRCHPQETIPFKALDAAMDELSDVAAPLDDLGTFDPRLARAAIRLFPVLKRIGALSSDETKSDAPGDGVDGSELRAQGVEALREIFARLARRGPIILWIDDVQWDDADSAALVEALFRSRGAPPMLLILGKRVDGPPSAIVQRLTESRALLALDRVRLGPLGDGDIARLAGTFLGSNDARVAGVVQQSEGNAFLASELARYLASSKTARSVSRDLDVHTLVAARLSGLTMPERKVLEVAALALRPLPVAWVLEAAGLDAASRTVVLGLRDGFLLRQGAAAEDDVAPYHDKIAEATQRLMTDEGRALVHGALASMLERRAPDDAIALTVHWETAGDTTRAGTFAFRAAEQAAGALAFGRAAQLYDKAVALGSTEGADPSTLLERAANAYANHGRAPEAARRYLEASRLLGDDVVDARVRTLKRLAAEQFVKSGYLREGWEVMRSVLDAVDVPLPRSPMAAQVSALGRRMKFLARRIDVDTIGSRTIPEHERARLEILWTASTSMSMVNVTMSDAFRTMHLERILDVGDRSAIARALAYEAALEAHVGGPVFDWHTKRLLDHARRLVERTRDPYDDAWLKLGIANEAFCAGRFRDAVVALEASEKILRAHCHGVSWEIATISAFLLMSLAMLGDLKKLREAAERITSESEANGDLFGIADGFGADCWLAWWATGQGDDALARVKAAVARQGGNAERWPEKNYRRGQLVELMTTVHASLLAGDPWPAWEMMLAHWDGLSSAMIPRLQFYRSWLRSARARVALACARKARPGGAWTRARLLADATKMHAEMAKDKRPFGPPWAALALGALERAKGNEDGARQALERAIVGFDRAEMALYREAARFRLAELTGEGARLATADAWFRAQGVEAPRLLVDALVPGY